VRLDLILLADCASFDIVGDPLFHAYPVMGLLNFSDRLVSPWVSGCWVVMIQDHEVAFHVLVVVDAGMCCVYESFWGNECNVFVIIFPLVGIQWSG
jgi:hypothetical protein